MASTLSQVPLEWQVFTVGLGRVCLVTEEDFTDVSLQTSAFARIKQQQQQQQTDSSGYRLPFLWQFRFTRGCSVDRFSSSLPQNRQFYILLVGPY